MRSSKCSAGTWLSLLIGCSSGTSRTRASLKRRPWISPTVSGAPRRERPCLRKTLRLWLWQQRSLPSRRHPFRQLPSLLILPMIMSNYLRCSLHHCRIRLRCRASTVVDRLRSPILFPEESQFGGNERRTPWRGRSSVEIHPPRQLTTSLERNLTFILTEQ